MNVRFANLNDLYTLMEHDKHISESEMRMILALKRVYVAEVNGNFVGFMRYGLFWDNTPFLNMIYMLEECRGKGIGKFCIEKWEAEMKTKGYKTVMTSTQANENALRFYIKLGYEAVGGFTPSGEPYELIISKEL